METPTGKTNVEHEPERRPERTLAAAIMQLAQESGGVTLQLPAREDSPRGADFGEPTKDH